MFTAYEAEALRRTYNERLRYAELCRLRDSALHRFRMRSALRRLIEAGLQHGIDPVEVEGEFQATLGQVVKE